MLFIALEVQESNSRRTSNKNTRTNPDVYMRIDKELSAIASKIDPGFCRYIRDAGSSIGRPRPKTHFMAASRVAWYGTIR